MHNKFDSIQNIKKIKGNYGFGLVDAIVSMSLLFGVITYGIYFSSLRLNTVYNSNLTRAINKEIQRDIERIKYDFWSMYFEENNACQGEYCLSNGEALSRYKCANIAMEILNLKSWNVEKNPTNLMIQSWRPDSSRSKVFSGNSIIITRELTLKSPLGIQYLDKSIASIDYIVQTGKNNSHWVSIYLSPEAHSWCGQVF